MSLLLSKNKKSQWKVIFRIRHMFRKVHGVSKPVHVERFLVINGIRSKHDDIFRVWWNGVRTR